MYCRFATLIINLHLLVVYNIAVLRTGAKADFILAGTGAKHFASGLRLIIFELKTQLL